VPGPQMLSPYGFDFMRLLLCRITFTCCSRPGAIPKAGRMSWSYPLVDILQCLKGTTAHRINKLVHRGGPVWQEESFDHLLRSDESLAEKCEYIRQNPVRRGLVQRAEDYRWMWVDDCVQRPPSAARG
jgi:hypothetical protein